jgi:hypothetical protein
MSKFKAAKEAGKLFEYFFDRLLKGFRKDQGRDPENLEMILIRQEAGNKAKEADKVIEVQFGKPFGEEVDELIKSGDVKIGEVTKKNDNVITREMFQNSNLNKPTIEGQMEKITEASNRLDEIMKEQADMYRPKTDAEIKAKFEKQNKDAAERLRKKMKDEPEDMATGGRAGYYTGGITDVEPSLDDIGHGSDSLMSRTRLMSPGSQATTSTGLNYLLAEDNDNLRVPFSKGKIAKEVLDKGRRGFMKAAGATGAGIAALKTGLLGLGEKAAPVVEKVAETVSETAQGVPPYFFRLVEKIKFMGDSTLATKDKANAYKFKDYVMEEDFAGNIEIIKKGEDLQGNKLEDVYMSYKVDEVPVKGKKGSAKVEDYEEFTARPDAEGKMKDIEPGIPDEVIEEAGDIDAMTLKKAEGGRIGFSKGKLATNAVKFLEKIFGKENMAEMPNRDPEMYQGMLEVVDMFRNRDKEGLKKYLQRFLPHMDDAQVEDLIVGDVEDMAGLGKFGLGNLQGQLIRLGSGRDYQSKIEAFKRLERNKSLKDLEVTEDMQRKPNASGGLAKMLGE